MTLYCKVPTEMNVSLGENMKQLELSAEKAVEREEKLLVLAIYNIHICLCR